MVSEVDNGTSKVPVLEFTSFGRARPRRTGSVRAAAREHAYMHPASPLTCLVICFMISGRLLTWCADVCSWKCYHNVIIMLSLCMRALCDVLWCVRSFPSSVLPRL